MKSIGKLYNNGGSLTLTVSASVVDALGLAPGDFVQYDIEKYNKEGK